MPAQLSAKRRSLVRFPLWSAAHLSAALTLSTGRRIASSRGVTPTCEGFAFVPAATTFGLGTQSGWKRIERLAKRPGHEDAAARMFRENRPKSAPGRHKRESLGMTERAVTVYSSPT